MWHIIQLNYFVNQAKNNAIRITIINIINFSDGVVIILSDKIPIPPRSVIPENTSQFQRLKYPFIWFV